MKHLLTGSALSVLLCMTSFNLHADDSGYIAVSGRGVVSATPDVANINAGVQVQGKTSSEAIKQNAVQMNALFKVLADEDIEDKQIQTNNFSINPIYDYSKNSKQGNVNLPTLLGYEVRNEVSIKDIDIDKLGALIDKISSAGGTNINNINFSISEQDELLKQARVNAVADAKEKAQQYADAAKLDLGSVISINEQGSVNPVAHLRTKQFAEAAFDSTPIAAGENELSVNLNVVFSIDD